MSLQPENYDRKTNLHSTCCRRQPKPVRGISADVEKGGGLDMRIPLGMLQRWPRDDMATNSCDELQWGCGFDSRSWGEGGCTVISTTRTPKLYGGVAGTWAREWELKAGCRTRVLEILHWAWDRAFGKASALAIASERQSGISLFLFWRRRYELKKNCFYIKIKGIYWKKTLLQQFP
jgi:hypothetical protein